MAKKQKRGKERLDKFYHLAKDQGFRARSAFKLIQLAKKQDFLTKARVCIDLCAAPGGWSQVAAKNMPKGSIIIAIDLVPIKSIPGVTCIQSDITTEKCRNLLKKAMHGSPADVVLHDGAPNVGTSWAKDAFSQSELVLHSLKLACEHMRQGGTFVTKVFRSADYNSLLWVFNQLFEKVEATKPTASRNVSAEIFVMCLKFKSGKIDPRFFDPKWVFMETSESLQEAGLPTKPPSQVLNDLLKNRGKRWRGGYEPGDDFRVTTVADFLESDNPANCLLKHNKLLLEGPGCEELAKSKHTTEEIKNLMADLKVLGKVDLSALLKWRMKIIRDRERVERHAAKEKRAMLEAGPANASEAVAKDLDDAIVDILDGGKAADGPEQDDVDINDEEIERELAEQIDKRRADEKRDRKKTMERQKKQEFRKKMSLANGEETQGQPELFRASKRNILALEDQDKYLDPEAFDSPNEEEEITNNLVYSDSDDDGLDKLTRMEVDMAVQMELQRIKMEDTNRNLMQRLRKKRKETRRKRILEAWQGEMTAFSEAIDASAVEHHRLKDKADAESDDESLDLEELREFQSFTDQQTKAIEEGPVEGGADGGELSAIFDMPKVVPFDEPKKSKREGEDPAERGAIVPLDVEGEEIVRAQRKAQRWFSQDIFAAMDEEERDSDKDSSDSDDVPEVDEKELPILPLTDKQKRKIARRKAKDKQEKKDARKHGKEDDDNRPMEVEPLAPPKSIIPSPDEGGPQLPPHLQKPSDPRVLAETLAYGSMLVDSKKSRMELIDAGYNKFTFDRDPTLPEWFLEEEDRCMKPDLPVTKEMMDQFRQKIREINARPIRKVAQAKARKKKRLAKRLQKLRDSAMALAESPDMSEGAKARQLRKAVSRMANQDKRKTTVIALKKGGGGNRGKLEKGKVPRGAKVKVVDRRMKADRRGEKNANKRNPARMKIAARKVQKMKTRTLGKRTAGGAVPTGKPPSHLTSGAGGEGKRRKKQRNERKKNS